MSVVQQRTNESVAIGEQPHAQFGSSLKFEWNQESAVGATSGSQLEPELWKVPVAQ
jgi:hypothetical protein